MTFPNFKNSGFSSPANGTGLSGRLTSLQGDENIQGLIDLIAAEADSPSGREVDYFSITGTNLFVHYTDHTIQGPLALPTWNLAEADKGLWTAVTAYSISDVFYIGGNSYVVMIAHTSAASFDPNATDGLGHNLYKILLTSPASVIPPGGTTGQVLEKSSAADFDIDWVTMLLSSLGDVSVSVSPPPDQFSILQWIGSTWVASDFGEISVSSLTSGDLLQYNGTAWTNLASGSFSIPFSQVSGTIAHSQLPVPAVGALGGVGATTAGAHQFLTSIPTSGLPTQAQPQQTDIADTLNALPGTTGTVSLDCSLGDTFTVTPTGNITLNATNALAGRKITLIIATSGVSSFNVTPATNFKSTGALATGTSSGKVFTMTFIGNGSTLFEVARTVAM